MAKRNLASVLDMAFPKLGSTVLNTCSDCFRCQILCSLLPTMCYSSEMAVLQDVASLSGWCALISCAGDIQSR